MPILIIDISFQEMQIRHQTLEQKRLPVWMSIQVISLVMKSRT